MDQIALRLINIQRYSIQHPLFSGFFIHFTKLLIEETIYWVVYPQFSPMCFVSYCRRQRRKRATKPCTEGASSTLTTSIEFILP